MCLRSCFLTFVCSLMLGLDGFAQQTAGLQIEASTSALLSSDEIRPLWLVANQWGRQAQFGQSGATAYGKAAWQGSPLAHLSLQAGVAGLYHNGEKGYLHEAYVAGRYRFIDFSAGKMAFLPNTINDSLTTGMYLGSSNAMPIPRLWLGIFDYTPLPFTNGWVEVRGAASHGWLDDDRTERGHQNVLLHEKFAYIRLGKTKVQPYVGLVHSALYGGEGIPADFWATFFGSGSEEVGGGEATNAAGAHMGLWHTGVTFSWGEWSNQVYFQMPFADGSGMHVNWGRNKDFITGWVLQRPGKQLFSSLAIELMRTDYQSGAGVPDPYDPVRQEIVWRGEIGDVHDFVAQRLPDMVDQAANWSEDDLFRYLRDRWNEGNFFGGRDDNMNNGMYYAGWTWQGMSFGTPMYHTADMAARFAPQWRLNNSVYFINTRVRAINLAASGWLMPQLRYRAKFTASRNYGAYGEEFLNRYSWVRTDGYYFEEAKNQFYNLVELEWMPARFAHWHLTTSLGYDAGDLYNAFGGVVTLAWRLN